MARKTYNEKLMDSRDMPKIVEITDAKAIARHGGNRMLIAPPLMYDAIMKRVPNGLLITADALRDYLARTMGANYTCPLTGGIFINIVAHASEERGMDITPYWRTLKRNGILNEKYPGGIDYQRELLEAEGHSVIQKGRDYAVSHYEDRLIDLSDLLVAKTK